MTKTELKAIMRMWEAKQRKAAAKDTAVSIEAKIENDIAYESMTAEVVNLAKKGNISMF